MFHQQIKTLAFDAVAFIVDLHLNLPLEA